MALSRLESLYRQVILDHSSRPRNFGALDQATGSLEVDNPTCGDVIHLHLRLVDDRIEDVSFNGHGCSISTASASMMTEQIKGKTMDESKQMIEEFLLLVQGAELEDSHLGDAEVLSGVAKFPARIRCATLSWKALERMLLNPTQNAKEESR